MYVCIGRNRNKSFLFRVSSTFFFCMDNSRVFVCAKYVFAKPENTDLFPYIHTYVSILTYIHTYVNMDKYVYAYMHVCLRAY